jgi:hypothetical protein
MGSCYGSCYGSFYYWISLESDLTRNYQIILLIGTSNCKLIVGGVYRIENLSSESPTFNGSFYMVKTDGNSSHSHEIYDLSLNTLPIDSTMSNVMHLNGTTTVTLRNVPVHAVPTNITLLGDSAISIWLDPFKVNNHFGDSPIYGTQQLKCVDLPAYCK